MALRDWLSITPKKLPEPASPPPPEDDEIPTPEGINYAELWKDEEQSSSLPLILSGIASFMSLVTFITVLIRG